MQGNRARTRRHPALTAIVTGLLASLTGVGTASAKSDGCPSEMVRVGNACVDRWEGSLVETLADGSEQPWSPYTPPTGHRVRAISRAGVVPQAHISYYDAKLACQHSHKRLCRADEWVRACKGPEHTRWPYGDDYVAGACVDYGRTPATYIYHPGRAAISYEGMNDPRVNMTPNTVALTGSANQCTNEYGAFDMVGNLHEWAGDGRFHGGYYLDTKKNGSGCDYVTSAHNGVYYDYSTGFRCCADAGTLDDADDADDADAEIEPALASVGRLDRALEQIAHASIEQVTRHRALAGMIAGLCTGV